MRGILAMCSLALALATGSAIAWLIWAEDEYSGSPQAPFLCGDLLGGPRLLAALALSLLSAAVMARLLWRPNFRPESIVLGLGTGAIALAAIFVASFFFAASLGCLD